MLIYENRQKFFSVNFDFRNGCKNEFQDNNEKSSNWIKNRVSTKIDFRAIWTNESHPSAWELNFTNNLYKEKNGLKAWEIKTLLKKSGSIEK